jgi:GNAT superfamily N-acetyltransferase
MPTTPFTLRRATGDDADAIAEVFSASFRLLSFLPELHTVAEDRWFIANAILRDCEVIVAEDDSGIVSFLALQGEEVRLLYTRPDRIGKGAGTQLIEAAKKSGVGALAFKPMPERAASMRRDVSLRSASLTERKTRRKRLTSATGGGNLTRTIDRRTRLPAGWPVCTQGGLWRVCATSTSVCPRRSQVTEANAPSHEPVAANTT